MGCRSDYMDPTRREAELQRTAKLYAYALRQLRQPVSLNIESAANDVYCKADYVPQLCELLTSLTAEDLDRIVYNARDKVSRDLADWWEEHQQADLKRLQVEAEQRKQALIKSAIAKLTREEAAALGLTKTS